MRKIYFLILSLLLIPMVIHMGCATYIPEKEIALADAAVQAAREANGHVAAPRLFQRAESALQSARRAKVDREFSLAKEFALKAITYAERSENRAVLKRERGEE